MERQSDKRIVSEAAIQALSRLTLGKSIRGLDVFLLSYPKYAKHRAELIRETRWAVAACAVAAYCHSYDGPLEPEEAALCVEAAIRESERDGRDKGGKKSCRSASSRSRISEYLEVFQYVHKRSGRLGGCADNGLHASLKAVAYLLAQNTIQGRARTDVGFGDTIHLIDELIIPLLKTIYGELTTSFHGQRWPSPRFDRVPYGT